MLKSGLLVVVLLVISSCSRTITYDSFSCAEVVIAQPVKHDKHLIVVSSPQCGWCSRALNAILKDSLTNVVDITFVEFLRKDNDYSKFVNIEVRKGDANCNKKHKEFFPVFYLYDRQTKALIYKQNGYPDDTTKKIRQKLGSSAS